jgi:hypothetical protein
MNHVFIGLGGTGGRIIYAVRRAICQHYPGGGGETKKRLENGTLGQPEVRTGFLYVDSHRDDLDRAHDYLGESITLDPRWRLLIRDGNLGAIIQNLGQLPGIEPWLGDRHALQGVLAGGGNVPGAQQLRRMGRVLFANHLNAFRDRVRNLVGEVTAGAPDEAHFHICGTLAGGTGSGAIVDAVTQLRKLYPNSDNFKIYLYGLITPDNAGNRDAGWFYPNQYAALLELNALATGAYRPHDIGASGERISANAEITACVLLSNVNKANIKFADVADQEQLAGDWLFQRTIGTRGTIPHGFDKAWTLEDHIATNPGEERLAVSIDRRGGAIQAGEYARSYRFSTIGIKRWAIPEQEIREKLVFTIAERAVRQALYSNWVEQQGFSGSRADRQPPAGWLPSNTNTAWELADDEMCLSVMDGQNPFREDWKNIAALLSTRLRADGNKRRETWLPAAEAEFRGYWQGKFRETGAENFFTTRTETVTQRADTMLRRIEDDLLKHWQAGRCGFRDLENWIKELDADLISREQALPKLREDHQDVLNAQKGRLELVRQQWKKPRLLTRWKFGSLLGTALDALAKIHTEETWLRARDYQEALFRALRAKLGIRKNALPSLISRLSQLETKLTDDAKARCKDSPQDFVNDLIVREFSSDEVAAFSTALTTSKDFQRQVCDTVRTAFIEMAANRLSITALSDLDADAMRSRIEKIANDALDIEHTRLTRDDGLKPVLGMSIVERLRLRFQGNLTALKDDIHKLLSGATTSVKQANGQPKPETRGAPDDPPVMPHTQFAVFLPPQEGANDEFYRQLAEYFRGGLPANANATVQLLNIGRRQEITMMAVDYWMAARFLEPLQTLKAKYEATLAREGAEGVLRMHVEAAAEHLPDLFKPLPVLKAARAWLFIGEKVGFIRQDADGGKMFVVFVGEDGRAYQPSLEIAVSRDGFFKGNVDARLAKLRNAFRTIYDRTSKERQRAWDEQLTAAINAEIDRIHAETGGKSESATYREWLELSEEIKRIWREAAR